MILWTNYCFQQNVNLHQLTHQSWRKVYIWEEKRSMISVRTDLDLLENPLNVRILPRNTTYLALSIET